MKLWVAGDWNGFFGLFTNVLLNVIVLTGLCLGVVQLPADMVFGRILPALGIALPLGNLFYAYLAYQLGKKEGRSDVTAMPYGPSVPHMFIVVFLVMLPVYLETKDAIVAWQAGLAWCFIIGVIVLIGAFIGPSIRALTPRAAMLGTLAGISIAFISMRPAFQIWEAPWIGFACFAIVLIAWTANMRLPGGVPGGLAAVIVGTSSAGSRRSPAGATTCRPRRSASRSSTSGSTCRCSPPTCGPAWSRSRRCSRPPSRWASTTSSRR